MVGPFLIDEIYRNILQPIFVFSIFTDRKPLNYGFYNVEPCTSGFFFLYSTIDMN
jgi:hypothetical protein